MEIELSGKILKTQTADGYELDGILFEPKDKNSIVIIHFHGKEGDFLQNHFIFSMAEVYPKNGFAFASVSHRGRSYIADILRKSATGYQYTQMGSAYDVFEDSLYDIDAWVNFFSARGYKKIILQQHSTPQKILWYAYKRKPKNLSALILISPGDVAYAFEKWVPDYKKNLVISEKMVKNGKGNDLMSVNLWSNCPVSARTFYNWGNPKSNIQVFNYARPQLGFKYFPKVTYPMIAILADDDFSVGNPSDECLHLLKQHSKSKIFETALIKGTNHGYQGKEDFLARTIVNWLDFTK